MNETKKPPPPNVWPTLRANDAHALIKFLTEALGFEATVVYAEGDTVHHAELAWPPGGGVMLGSARPGDPRGITRPGNLSTYVVTSDPDALFARAVAHGAKVIQELYDTDYGSRDFAVEDPEGNRWTFGTYPGAPRSLPAGRPRQQGSRQAEGAAPITSASGRDADRPRRA